jgi:hypothetical protein
MQYCTLVSSIVRTYKQKNYCSHRITVLTLVCTITVVAYDTSIVSRLLAHTSWPNSIVNPSNLPLLKLVEVKGSVVIHSYSKLDHG